MFVHGNNDTDGAVASIEKIVAGLGWELAQRPVTVADSPDRTDLDACWELGAALAAGMS
jgi:flavorubredoxin